jgi:hydrogenase maturation protease
MTADTPRVLVLGVGNPLMRDDGIGPRVVEMLRAGFAFPDSVDVVDAGTMSFMILDLLRDIDRLIVIDAVDGTELPPGTVVVMTPEEIAPNQVKHSMHDVGLVDVLQAAALIDRAPETAAVAVQIEAIEEWVLDLSQSVEDAIPVAAAAVLELLRSIGIEPTVDDSADMGAQIIAALRSGERIDDPARRPSGT